MFRQTRPRPRISNRTAEPLERRVLLTAGDLDPSFSGDGKLLSENAIYARTANDVAVQNDGKVLVIGQRRLASDFSLSRATDFTLSRFNLNGSPDTTFGAGGTLVADLGGYDTGVRVLSLSDRRIVAGSTSVAPDSSATWVLSRYHPDGSPDASFGTNGVTRVPAGINGYLADLALAPDGKLLAVGRTAASRFTVMRFTPSGQPDPTFSGDGVATFDFGPANDDAATAVAVLPDGRPVIAGYAASTTPGLSTDLLLLRLTQSGGLDATFDGDGVLIAGPGRHDFPTALALDAAGRPVLTAQSDDRPIVLRFTPSGAADPTFSGDGVYTLETTAWRFPRFSSVGIAPNGDIVAAGSAAPPTDGTRDFFVTRLNPTGNRLAQFADDFHADSDDAYGVAFAPDGKLLVAGTAVSNGFTGVAVARYLAAPPDATFMSRDTTFDGDGRATQFEGFSRTVNDVLVQPDRKIVVGGTQVTALRQDFFLARYNPDGTPDNTFEGNGRVATYLGANRRSEVRSLLLMPDGRIVAVGIATQPGATHPEVAVARYNPDGSLDPTFGGDGTVVNDFGGTRGGVFDAALYPGGKLVVAGGPGLIRYNPDGSLDRSFDGDGLVTGSAEFPVWPQSVLVQGDKILADRDVRVIRYNANGSPDPTFASPELEPGEETGDEDAYSSVTRMAFAPDGDVVVLGHVHDHGDEREKYALWRINPDGTLDNGFGRNGSVWTSLDDPFHIDESGFAVQPDGKIVVTGYGESSEDPTFLSTVVRHLPDGRLDGTFAVEGVTILDMPGPFLVTRPALDPTGDIVVAGNGGFGTHSTGYAIVRIEGTGSEGNIAYDRTARTLTVTGGDGNDTIALSASSGRVFVTFNGRTTNYTRTSLRTVRVFGRNGNDTVTVSGQLPDLLVQGNGGDDTLHGGSGRESLDGRDGNDFIDGGLGADTLLGGQGTDTVDYRSRTRDLVIGGFGSGSGEAGENDTLGSFEKVYGGSGNDRIGVSSFAGAVFAGPGNDTLLGQAGADALWGEAGDDVLMFSEGNDYLRGGPGVDTYNALNPNDTANLDITLDGVDNDGRWYYFGGRVESDNVYADIENVIGGRGDDRITGSAASNRLDGGEGHDTLVGLAGNDTLLGGNGDDTLTDTQGSNTLDGGRGIDTINGVTEQPAGTILQAEDAARTSAAVATRYAGYTGSGYVEFVGDRGTVTWTFNAPAAGRRSLSFRYANGNSFTAFSSVLSVNGAQAPADFRPTGAWTTWRTIAIDVDLQAGANTITLSANPTELVVDWMTAE